jgi:anti-anti-sigma regulatory factor
MSCKIDRIVESDGVVLRVSGQLHGEHVETLRELIRVERGMLALDLVEVTSVDRAAVRLLAASEINRTELRNSPAYVREWVTREKDQTGG